MSFQTFPSSLPYFDALHDQSKLDADIKGLSTAVDVTKLQVAEKMEEEEGHPFVDALHGMSNLQRTTNNALAHKSTEDACLDLYYQLGVSTDTELVFSLLDKAWKQDPTLTLHVIWHARSIHRGKSANDRFYVAFGWLIKNHPQTAIRNVHLLSADVVSVTDKPKNKDAGDDWDMVEKERLKSHGYWKDLLNVCTIYVQDEFKTGPTGDDAKFKALNCPRQKGTPWNGQNLNHRYLSHKFYESIKNLSADEQAAKRAERKEQVAKKCQKQREEQKQAKLNKRATRHTRIQDLLANDPVYRSLHFTVARLFVTQLEADLKTLKAAADSKKKYVDGLSLAAKWAPSLQHAHDKHTLLATSISEALFPPAVHQQADESREHYINKVRELYRKQVISPLRKALDITERRMSLNEWTSIDFSHVPSKCMQANMPHFVKHAKDQYVQFLKDVALGKKSVSGATLQPHELIERANCAVNNSLPPSVSAAAKKYAQPEAVAEIAKVERQLVNAQWKTLVDSIRQDTGGNATLGSCIAVCDMSGSMCSRYVSPIIPLWSAIGLSIILAEFAASPFAGHVITFSEKPTLVQFDPEAPLTEKLEIMNKAPAGFSTNFLSVFLDLLLPMAKRYNLKQEDMVKRLYVFSDMEFNEGCGTKDWNTTYEEIKKAYDEAGYEVPELVWWNLGGSRPTDYGWLADDEVEAEAPIPVTKDVKGCAMLCGYSAAMLKSFLEGDKIEDPDQEKDDKMQVDRPERSKLDPLEEMKKAVEHKSFNDLVVVD
ncbi:hypothetical protein O0I10_007292 [Lichtheimia ornata]|uniref:Uncharacterized protein n=1 Tax=Lichtheimia ornata TaxID=688661 RepID=A0AAD7V0D0_9FUNG|nr:uncharacterized protein O0I10_007292 [Lichtheimia ornata]KAJ8656958.1 hypothetical protein O0I10_007292 [Lichtheimia ornata]